MAKAPAGSDYLNQPLRTLAEVEAKRPRAYFRPDNTAGYDAADLAALNLAWEKIISHGAYALDSDDLMLDNWAETLLAEYDVGKRGGGLVAWFYTAEVALEERFCVDWRDDWCWIRDQRRYFRLYEFQETIGERERTYGGKP